MDEQHFLHLGSLRDASAFKRHLEEHNVAIPCDEEVSAGEESPLARPLSFNGTTVGNRFAIHPMEGWDGTADGRPTELTMRRWRNFGRSGAKLIWGGEAVAVLHEGRANPNQLVIAEHTRDDLARLRAMLLTEHRQATGSTDGLLIGLQLTHSGRYCQPNVKGRPEPRILYHHPILDKRLGLDSNHPLMTDGEIRRIIEVFHRAAHIAQETGFDFVDVKHCHGYLGHEFLSAHTRDGDYGGSFEGRTRFLREVVEGIRSSAPGLEIGVRLSAFDIVPFRPDPARSTPGKPGGGIPEEFAELLPYRCGFGVNVNDPTEPDLTCAARFLSLLGELGIKLVNISAGSPYYNPHVQRPALFPPSDGYLPPEDPLVGVARQMNAARELKQQFPNLLIVGTAFSYLQEFLPNVAQAAVRGGWADSIGLGRMVLAYPELPLHVLDGRKLERKRLCRTFSDCTTAPRNGLPSGCYPLDPNYKNSEMAARLTQIKNRHREHFAEA
ncbi:MAG TPA: NADH:flavin oxidoreductase [Blastocatellia bacterium]|nr:NADH:flavin oxidoreductase [Blastocatellia bacterium]